MVAAVLVPLAVSGALYSTRYCAPGTYPLARKSGSGGGGNPLLEKQQCAPCAAGTYALGGFFKSSVCRPGPKGTYAASKGAGSCLPCPGVVGPGRLQHDRHPRQAAP